MKTILNIILFFIPQFTTTPVVVQRDPETDEITYVFRDVIEFMALITPRNYELHKYYKGYTRNLEWLGWGLSYGLYTTKEPME